jgi:DNA-binding response OmpR family regulator
MHNNQNTPPSYDRSTPVGTVFLTGLVYLDDSAVALKAMRKALVADGLVLEAYQTADALLQRSREVALVAALLDIDLGGSVDGVQVARALKQIWPSVQLAFFTAEDFAHRAETLRDLGRVFDKHLGPDEAIEWFLSVTRT